MLPDYYDNLAMRQEIFWWNRARRYMCLRLLQRFGAGSGCRWIDLGCGAGGNLRFLDALAPRLVTGVDLSPKAIELAHRAVPGAALIRCDLSRGLPFATGAFDLAAIFNVLCHSWVASEVEVLLEVRRIVRPGGLVLMTEPAFPILFREMDVIGQARRRYRLTEFLALCGRAGLAPLAGSYFSSFGFPILLGIKAMGWLKRVLGPKETKLGADMKLLHPVMNEALYRVAVAEAAAIARGASFPFGTTLVCVARTPGRPRNGAGETPLVRG